MKKDTKEASVDGNCILEANHALEQAMKLKERARRLEKKAEKHLDLWAKIKCPYQVGDKLKLPKNIWKHNNFIRFEGLDGVSHDTEFIVTDVNYDYACDTKFRVLDSPLDIKNLYWVVILREKYFKSNAVYRIPECYFK